MPAAARSCPAAGLHPARVVALVEARLERSGRLGRYTMAEVARHNSKESGWVVVDGKVFDITHHVVTHPGWECGCATSQLLAILRTLGTDCTEEVHEIHSRRALAQFAPYLIGLLVEQESATSSPAQHAMQQISSAARQPGSGCPVAAKQ